MRIGIFTDFYYPHLDGVAISVETFRMELEKLGHEVYVFAPAPGLRYKEPSPRVIRFPAFKVEHLNDAYFSFFFPPQAIRTIEKLNLDIIHYQNPTSISLLGLYTALKNDIPVVTTYHTDAGQYVKHYPTLAVLAAGGALFAPFLTRGGLQEFRMALGALKPSRSDWSEKMMQKVATILHNRTDLVIAPSEKMRKLLTSMHTETPMVILPTGVDKITTKSAAITRFKKRHDLADDRLVILYVGRLSSEKNVELLVKAFVDVKSKVPNAHLLLAGSGIQHERIESNVAKLGLAKDVTFTGYVNHDELGAVYGAADLFAFPSTTDTQALVVNEAASAGLPLVLVDGQINEVLIDGKSGYLAKNNAKDLAAKITKILKNDTLRYEMGREARRQALKYTTSKQAVKLLRLYQDVIKKHQQSREQTQPQKRKNWIQRRRDT